MDLLCSIGLDSLPEQSTRLTSHPGTIKTLEDNADARLGFTSCCNCGTDIDCDKIKVVKCKGCQRVSYCSKSCCKADSEDIPEQQKNSGLDDDMAFGHSAVICSLLKLCNDDEDAEDKLFNDTSIESHDQKQGDAKEAALYRVQTERESYPATLFNILSESPMWFMEAMTRRIRYLEDPRSPLQKQRRGKRDRNGISPTKPPSPVMGNKQLIIHIVGASTNSELWGWDGRSADAAVLDAYAEASTNLVSYLESFPIVLKSIRLIFIGPDCSKSCKHKVSIPESKTMLIVETHCYNYGEHNQHESVPSPDVIVFFNPGFSCPDYDWSKALSAAAKFSTSWSTPLLVTTNTEMEGFADIKYLLDGGYINAKSIPDDVCEAIDYSRPKFKSNVNDEDRAFFFGENPYHGLRVRQSGTMANDIYVKSKWMFGALIEKSYNSKKAKTKELCKIEDEESHERPRKKYKKEKGNNKKSNPALI